MTQPNLPEGTLENLKRAMNEAKAVETFIRQAKTAKIDIGDAEKRLREMKTRIYDIRNGFFPNESLEG